MCIFLIRLPMHAFCTCNQDLFHWQHQGCLNSNGQRDKTFLYKAALGKQYNWNNHNCTVWSWAILIDIIDIKRGYHWNINTTQLMSCSPFPVKCQHSNPESDEMDYCWFYKCPHHLAFFFSRLLMFWERISLEDCWIWLWNKWQL